MSDIVSIVLRIVKIVIMTNLQFVIFVMMVIIELQVAFASNVLRIVLHAPMKNGV